MLPLRAHVKNGQIVLNEPADLPEGAALTVVVEEEDNLDDMTPEERAELNRVLDVGIADMRAGRVVDGDEVVSRLPARP